MSMEGIIQYRLLGNHPAASGRYLTVGFPGETTTTDKLLEQVIQEHRINTSRYKLDVCRLVVSRDTSSSPSPPPPGGAARSASGPTDGVSDGTFSGSGTVAGAQSTLVPVVIHGSDVLRTYDRLTITVSKRDLADDEAARKEKERLERQQQLKEMEEQLLSTGAAPPLMMSPHAGGASRVAPSSRTAGSGGARGGGARSPVPRSSATASGAAVDPLRLQRAALLAGQLFPIMQGKQSGLSSLEDSANTHQCVLCRLAAFQEELTPCCRFVVCHACYASAAEMVMEEGQCPVCGAAPAAVGGAATHSPAPLKRARGEGGEADDVPAWKREGDAQKAALQRAISAGAGAAAAAAASTSRGGGVDDEPRGGYEPHAGQRGGSGGAPVAGRGRSPKTGPRGSGGDGGALAGAYARDVAQIEERLRNDLDQVLSMLDAPDPLTAAAKARRVMSAELAALCE